MLSSLPSLPPLNAHELYFPSLSSSTGAPPADSRQLGAHGHMREGGARPLPIGVVPRSPYAVLRADENAIATRKANIRRFGAGWIRPPGVAKTLQGMDDERAEREEQEAAALRYDVAGGAREQGNSNACGREQALADAQAMAEAELQQQRQQLAQEAEDEAYEDERDLDDDIPEATDVLDDTEDLSRDEGEFIDEAEGGLPPQDEEGDGDYAEGTDALGEESEMARDLDDDVPEAGSYQHTDTDVEDSSSEGEIIDNPWAGHMLPPTMAAARQSLGAASLGTSIFGSSPVVDTATARRSRGRGRPSG